MTCNMIKKHFFDTPDLTGFDFVPHVSDDKKSDTTGPEQALYDMIYESDPVTGLPKGDIVQFLSAETNPQVKQFIQMQLQRPNGDSVNTSDLSDDDILALSRNDNESKEEYLNRLRTDYFPKRKEG